MNFTHFIHTAIKRAYTLIFGISKPGVSNWWMWFKKWKNTTEIKARNCYLKNYFLKLKSANVIQDRSIAKYEIATCLSLNISSFHFFNTCDKTFSRWISVDVWLYLFRNFFFFVSPWENYRSSTKWNTFTPTLFDEVWKYRKRACVRGYRGAQK